jgi:predicted O-methyltransferase YrrM
MVTDNGLLNDFPGVLSEIYDAKGGPPAISPDTARFLAVLMEMGKPKDVLEIGCSFGFSSCLMAGFLAEGGSVTTIERNAALYATARLNFEKSGMAGKISLLEGDALDLLPALLNDGKRYDFIFMDAAKGQYVNFLPFCLDLLNVGGVLAADNVYNKGYVTAERGEVPRRQRTAHGRLREFIRQITETGRLRTAVLPIGDGFSVSVKIM